MATGELALFLEIWNERPHVSEVSGLPLPCKENMLWIHIFSHLLPKSIYGRFRLRKDNIVLMLPSEHSMWGSYPHLLKDKPEWNWVFEKRDELRIEYHRKK